MHPIERLRAVARAGWAAPSDLGAEAAWALAELAEREPHAVLPACRRLLDHRPDCGPLWWVAARVLSAGDQVSEAERCADELDIDPTAELVDEMGDGGRVIRRGGMGEIAGATAVVVRVTALGHSGMVIDRDAERFLAGARHAEVPVWVEAGVGRVLPARLWDALAARVEASTHAPSGRIVDVSGVALVVGPDGGRSLPDALRATDCPEPAELLVSW